MSNLRQAAQQALEALESDPDEMVDRGDGHWDFKHDLAITALRAALAEPEQPHDLLCVCGAEWDIYSDGREELVAAPTPRKPLTDEHVEAIIGGWWRDDLNMRYAELCRLIEAAHGITGEQK